MVLQLFPEQNADDKDAIWGEIGYELGFWVSRNNFAPAEEKLERKFPFRRNLFPELFHQLFANAARVIVEGTHCL